MPSQVNIGVLILCGVFGGFLSFLGFKVYEAFQTKAPEQININNSKYDRLILLYAVVSGAFAAIAAWIVSEAASQVPLVYVVGVITGIIGGTIINGLITFFSGSTSKAVPELAQALKEREVIELLLTRLPKDQQRAILDNLLNGSSNNEKD